MVGVENQLCRQLPDPEQQLRTSRSLAGCGYGSTTITFLIVSLSLLITKYPDAMVDVKKLAVIISPTCLKPQTVTGVSLNQSLALFVFC